MKKWLNFMFVIILIIPFVVNAESNIGSLEETEIIGPIQKEVVASTTKYYKTVTIYNNSSVMREAGQQEIQSITTELTKAEYDAVEVSNEPSIPLDSSELQSITVETNYKELTSSISRFGGFYDYKAELNWKQIPRVRSYDIIGIGHYGTVQIVDVDAVVFTMEYCTTSNCYISSGYDSVVQRYGSASVFPMPTNTLISLSQTIEFTVEKATAYQNETIILQQAAGDYSHATSTVNLNTVLNNVDLDIDGLYLSSTIRSSYDTTPSAIAEWEGTW